MKRHFKDAYFQAYCSFDGYDQVEDVTVQLIHDLPYGAITAMLESAFIRNTIEDLLATATRPTDVPVNGALFLFTNVSFNDSDFEFDADCHFQVWTLDGLQIIAPTPETS